MPLVEEYRGYSIFDAVSARVDGMAHAATAYRVRRPDGSQLGTRPIPSLVAARHAIDEDLAAANAAAAAAFQIGQRIRITRTLSQATGREGATGATVKGVVPVDTQGQIVAIDLLRAELHATLELGGSYKNVVWAVPVDAVEVVA